MNKTGQLDEQREMYIYIYIYSSTMLAFHRIRKWHAMLTGESAEETLFFSSGCIAFGLEEDEMKMKERTKP